MIMNKKIKCNLVVCGPAVGKTYLAKQDNIFIDLDELKATYKYGLNDKSREELENGKMQRGKSVNNDLYDYIINIINEIILNKKIGLLSHNDRLIKYLIDNNISYCLVYH